MSRRKSILWITYIKVIKPEHAQVVYKKAFNDTLVNPQTIVGIDLPLTYPIFESINFWPALGWH